jgi:hypothetical protein
MFCMDTFFIAMNRRSLPARRCRRKTEKFWHLGDKCHFFWLRKNLNIAIFFFQCYSKSKNSAGCHFFFTA